jgi:hypothetical protein
MKFWLLFAASVASTAAATVGLGHGAAAATPDPRSFAVAGVKLEMTVEEAEAALKAYDPSLKIEAHNQAGADGASEVYLSAIKPDDRYPLHFSEEVGVAFTRAAPHRALAITHDKALPPERERNFPDVVKQITEAYGPYAKTTAGFHDWVFDAAGAPIDGAPDAQTAETSDRFTACWHGLFEHTVSLYPFNFGAPAPNGLPVTFHPGCGVSVRVIVHTLDPARPTAVQEIVERLMSDALAVADGRSTKAPPTPAELLRKINPHGPDVPNADASGKF